VIGCSKCQGFDISIIVLVCWFVGWLAALLVGWWGGGWLKILREKKKKRPTKVIGWHMLKFEFLAKVKVGYGSNCTKFPKTDQRSAIL
jgi:hypothetical protein